jgi:hypothetical protein
MATREFLTTAKARAFMRAYRRALKWVIESPAPEIADREASFFPAYSTEAIAAAIARYQKLGTWREDPSITREQYDVAMDVFIHAGVFKDRYAFEDVVVKMD